jgi:hypothetical protein
MDSLYLSYKGESSNTLYTAYLDTSRWCGNDPISDELGGISPESNYNPGVAVYNNRLYLVYKGKDSNTLYTAYFDGITWYGNEKIVINKANGEPDPKSNYNPGVAVYNNRLYLAYKGEDSNTLYTAYFDGTTWYGNTPIKEQPPGGVSPESNYNPGVAVYNNRLYLVYKHGDSNSLYTAYFDGTKWYGDQQIGDGIGGISPKSNYNPGVAVFTTITRPNWMSDNLKVIGNQSLKKIVIPAAHDAGMYMLRDCTSANGFGATECNIRTQTKPIFSQLQSGIRYFDIRPVFYQQTMFTAHYSIYLGVYVGCFGPTIAEILRDVLSFMSKSKDLILLKFSHYYDLDNGNGGFSDDQMRLLCSLIAGLGPLLYSKGSISTDLSSLTVNEFISTEGKVLPILDSLKPNIQKDYSGIYSYADFNPVEPASANLLVYDNYSDTNNLDDMVSDQLKKLGDTANHQDNLFLLSWTLTQSFDQVLGCILGLEPSILDLASKANNALSSKLREAYEDGRITKSLVPNLIYVDNAGVNVTDFAIWLNNQLLATP